jgi:hypothetical protein
MSPAQQEAFLARLLLENWPLRTYTHNDWRYGHLDSIPASYVICQRDTALPASWQRRFAFTLRVDKRVTIDAGHQAMNTHSRALARILLVKARLTPSSRHALAGPLPNTQFRFPAS